MTRLTWAAACVFYAVCGVACAPDGPGPVAGIGTAEQRAELFDTILARVERREAFSAVKNEALGVDPVAEMSSLRQDFVSASDPVAFYYALSRLSNARRDRHLDVALVPGGIRLPHERGAPHADESKDVAPLHAPIRVLPDYGTPGEVSFFVSDLANALETNESAPRLGDRILAVNGRSFEEYMAAAVPYHRHSSLPNLWWRMALALPERTALLPPELYREELELELERLDGTVTRVALPYLEPASLEWQGAADPRYPGFSLHHSTETYDLHLPDQGGLEAVVLRWYGFRETLVQDVHSLMAFASREGLLDHAVIIDGTRSRGGSKGAYALQRFAARPFRVTFGNLRISDVILPFVEEKRVEIGESGALDSGVGETMDDGRWLMDWLENDVLDSLEAGAVYTNAVPFKLAHLPKDSDGVLEPAAVRFRGPLVLLLGPQGGSHLDQFAAQVIDNQLGRTIGMPAGGYSNTWEWEEILTLPGTDRPLVRFMYNIGHTIRPNGEILEGRAAPVDDFVPLTRENFTDYYGMLLERALGVVAAGRAS